MNGKVTKNCKSSKEVFMNTSMYSWKDLADGALIGGWSIFDFERHYNPYKSPPISNKNGFVLVFRSYGNLMVSKKTI
jgi:hypothetical protein